VNNFSEVNSELIEELKTELSAGNHQSAKEIANSIKANQEKINAHGKRADGIVKSTSGRCCRPSGLERTAAALRCNLRRQMKRAKSSEISTSSFFNIDLLISP
jgi:hypothetical protein